MKNILLTLMVFGSFGLICSAEEQQKNITNFYCEIKPGGAYEDFWVDACPMGSVLYYTITKEKANAANIELGYPLFSEELTLFDFEARASLFIAKNCDLSNNVISKTIGYDDLLRHEVICTKTEQRKKKESRITYEGIFGDNLEKK